MISRNVDEYRLIRQEMINLKDCITKYIGYVFAGSGAMIYGLARIHGWSKLIGSPHNNATPTQFMAEVAFISSTFSVLITLVLLTLFYKFHSHNRFAGFCKLLNHERHEAKGVGSQTPNEESPLMSWEITVGDLRWLESNPNYLGNIIEKLSISEPREDMLTEKVEMRIGINNQIPRIDSEKFLRGFKIIFKTLTLQNIGTDSWGFPPLVVCTFLFLTLGFLGASIFMVGTAWYKIGFCWYHLWIAITVYVLAVILLQAFLWRNLCGKLCSLMEGSATVYSFYWKFIPLRTLFLNQLKPKIKPTYVSTKEYIFNKQRNGIQGANSDIDKVSDDD